MTFKGTKNQDAKTVWVIFISALIAIASSIIPELIDWQKIDGDNTKFSLFAKTITVLGSVSQIFLMTLAVILWPRTSMERLKSIRNFRKNSPKIFTTIMASFFICSLIVTTSIISSSSPMEVQYTTGTLYAIPLIVTPAIVISNLVSQKVIKKDDAKFKSLNFRNQVS